MHARVDCSPTVVVCTYVDTPGHLSAYSTLDTPGGNPLQGTPDGFDRPMHGNTLAFIRPNPESPGGKSLGDCYVSSWQGGSTTAVAMNGTAEWLQEERTAEELVQAFEETYPQMPRLWLQQMAEHIQGQVAAKGLRMRCGATLRRRGRNTVIEFGAVLCERRLFYV